MKAISAQELSRSYDCATPGCERDAREPGGKCDHCERYGGSTEVQRLAARIAEQHRAGEPITVPIPQTQRGPRTQPGPRATSFAAGAELSVRELEVLRLVVDGYENREIATRLYISVETVKTHVRHILEKLDARSRTQAVAIAYRNRLVK